MTAILLVVALLFVGYRFRSSRQAIVVTTILVVAGEATAWMAETNFYRTYVDPQFNNSAGFEINDMLTPQEGIVDSTIVLVNIGYSNRRETSSLISKINEYKPRLIGVDLLFNCEGGLRDSVHCPQLMDTLGNLMLAQAITEAPKIVLAGKVHGRKQNIGDSLELSDPLFTDRAEMGITNLDLSTDGLFKYVKGVQPTWLINGKEELSFAAKVAMNVDSMKLKRFLSRKRKIELINFRRAKYYTVEGYDLLSDNVLPQLFRDKIVLVGYLGGRINDLAIADGLIVPLKLDADNQAESFMPGIAIHANILSMILDGAFIDEQPAFEAVLMNFCFCLMHVWVLFYTKKVWPAWFDLIATIIIVAQISLLSWFRIEMFELVSYKMFFGVSLITLGLAGVVINVYDEMKPGANAWLSKIRTRTLRVPIRS